MMQNFISTSIGKKVAMAISAIFLMVFLLQHFLINITSVFSEDLFNMLSHFMGTNPLVQFILQPVLIAGVIFHFVMGFYLEIQNRRASKYEYFKERGGANSTWMSRNMIWSGLVILSFLVLHFIDFWFPEMNYKYIVFKPEDPNRYYEELVHKFEDIRRVVFYCISFVLLSLHLLHGFSSSLKSTILTLFIPSAKTFTVPSGNFKSCRIELSHPYINTSVFFGSSTSEFFCVTKIIFLLFFITSFRAVIDLSLPTNRGITILGNTTMSLSGKRGDVCLTSIN